MPPPRGEWFAVPFGYGPVTSIWPHWYQASELEQHHQRIVEGGCTVVTNAGGLYLSSPYCLNDGWPYPEAGGCFFRDDLMALDHGASIIGFDPWCSWSLPPDFYWAIVGAAYRLWAWRALREIRGFLFWDQSFHYLSAE
jgi:hypothetical protein